LPKQDLLDLVPVNRPAVLPLPQGEGRGEGEGTSRVSKTAPNVSDEPILLAARFQNSKPGPVRLKLSGVNTPKAWLDGKPVSGSSEIIADLSAGPHTFLLKLDSRQLSNSLKLESPDVSFFAD